MAGFNYTGTMATLANRIGAWIVRARVPLLMGFIAITGVLGYAARNLELDPGFDKSLPLSHPYMQVYTKYQQVFGGANAFLIALQQKQGDIFNAEFFNQLEKVADETAYVLGVDKSTVISLFSPSVYYVVVDESGFVGGNVVPAEFQPDQAGLDLVRGNILKSNEIGKSVAKDFTGAMIRAELAELDPATGKRLDYKKVAEQLQALQEKYTTENISLHVIGFAKFIGDVIDGATGVILFFVITLIITSLLLYLFCRSAQLTALAVITALVGVIWQLGLITILGYGIDPMSILVPFLLLSIGVSHAVQMTNTWRLEVIGGATASEASRNAFGKLFIPGATALLTNVAGFGVIMLIDIAIIRELGITASIGMAVMIITNKFLLPVLLTYAKLDVSKQTSVADNRANPLYDFLASLTRRNRSLGVIAGALVMLGVGLWVRPDLVIGDAEVGAPELWPDSRYNQDAQTIIDHYNIGIDELTVFVETKPDGCVDYGIMQNVDRFEWLMQNLAGVQSARALTSWVKILTAGNAEGVMKFYNIARDPQAIGSNIVNIEMNQKLFNSDCSTIPVRIYVADHKAETLRRVVTAVKDYNRDFGTADTQFTLASGNAGVMAAVNEAVEESQIRMLVSLFIAVALLTFATFASWRVSLCILLPLAVVSIFADAVMVWMDIGIKVSTLPVVALGVGVGVDYGIYLFARAQAYLKEGYSLEDAFREGLRQSGSAVLFTAITMTIGVATWYFSELKFQSDMGLLLAYMFFVNMLGAVILLPALAYWIVGDPAGKARQGAKS